MLHIIDCAVGSSIELFFNGVDQLSKLSQTSPHIIEAVYVGYYPNNQESGDPCLIGWTHKPVLYCAKKWTPTIFLNSPQINNSSEYKYFRWCGGARLINRDLGFKKNVTSSELKPGELSPIHAPGWHQCRCGFRNQDISISAIIAGKYVCYQCRNIWKK